jgi:hypothetical protein
MMRMNILVTAMHENDAHEEYDAASLIRYIFNWIESEFQNIFNRQKEPKYFFYDFDVIGRINI